MNDHTLELQAKKYANELNTFAYEYGFTSVEGWCVTPTSEAKKNEVEKKFYPTLSIPVQPGVAEDLLNLVLSKLKHVDNSEEKAISDTLNKSVLYLTAYNPSRKA